MKMCNACDDTIQGDGKAGNDMACRVIRVEVILVYDSHMREPLHRASSVWRTRPYSRSV